MSAAERAKSIFLAAVEISGAEDRSAYLNDACGNDAELRRRVDRLLHAHDQDDSLLDRTDELPRSPSDQLGEQMGPYKIREVIGEGGMGTVYVAEQQRPIRRKVALKVIKPGMDSKAVIARFDAERQALALMDHPNIAKVLDAGTTESGRPYFVMELIQGQPITDYCDDKKLAIKDRLELFTHVCLAVQHAHQKGIIHRDIKPNNVLITEIDGNAVPKVIDFGVAKALSTSLTEQTVYTNFQTLIGTPLYMSPEQAKLSGVDVDTRSDVYSLGVLLYELLTGDLPFERGRIKRAALDEVCRIIREEEPPSMSQRVSSLGETAIQVSQNRGTEPAKLIRSLKNELTWIVAKAMDKERNRRYDTPAVLAEDVRSYLSDESISAGRPTPWSSGRRYAKKHWRGLVAFAFIFFVAVTSTYQAVLLRQKTAELQGTLATLWESLADIAFNAAFSGDFAEAFSAIQKAEEAKAPPALTETLKGVSLFLNGQHNLAVSRLLAISEDDPGHIAANATLSWVYFNQLKHGKHESSQQKYRSGNYQIPPHATVYDDFFICMEGFVDGSTDQMELQLERINKVITRKKHWGAAYVLRALILRNYARQQKSVEYILRALEDMDHAYELIPNSPMVTGTALSILDDCLYLAEANDEKKAEWKRRAVLEAAKIGIDSSDTMAIRYAASIQKRYGDIAAGQSLSEEVISRSEPGEIVWATEKGDYDKKRLPLKEWRLQTSNHEMQICVAISLAASDPTAEERQEVRAILKRLIQAKPAAAFYAIMMDAAMLLGDSNLQDEILKAGLKSKAVKEDHQPFLWLLQFYANEISAERHLEMASPFPNETTIAYYGVAMRALSNGEPHEAARYFKKVVELEQLSHWAYHSSKVFLGRIKNDRSWLSENLKQ